MGVKGQGLKKLVSGDELLYLKRRAVVLQFTKPSIYTVKGKAPYGISTKRAPNSDKTFFVVSKISQEGSIGQWNEEFPSRRVSIGDVLLEVNGVKGSASEVQTMLAHDPDEEKEILVFHYPDMV